MKIPYVDLSYQHKTFKKSLVSIFEKVITSGEFVGGKEIIKLENNLAKLCKAKYAVALNSGTDALTIALHVCGIRPGDDNYSSKFICCIYRSNYSSGCRPVFVDVLPDQNIDEKNFKSNYKENKSYHACSSNWKNV